MPAIVRLGDLSKGHPPFPPTPNDKASTNVLVNGKGVHREGDTWKKHCTPSNSCHIGKLKKGSSTVFVNGKPVARSGDPIDCGDYADKGSTNVFSG